MMDKSHVLEAVAGMVQQLNAIDRPEDAAVAVLEVAGDLLGWDAGYVSTYSEADGTVTGLFFADTEGAERRAVTIPERKTPSEFVSWVLKEGPQMILRDQPELEAEARLRGFGASRRSASLLYVPMKVGERSAGIISVQSYTLRQYGEDDLVLLQLLGNCCAGAIERIRAEQAVESPAAVN